MSSAELQSPPNEHKKFMTRLAFAYEYKIPYTIVMDRVRRGELAVHFVDNNVQIDVEEALKACERKRQPRSIRADLFA